MNELQIFENPEFGSIRTVEIGGEPWFVVADVCRALDISNPTDALKRLDDDERARFNLGHPMNETNCVNEPGLYTLVLGSRKPEAKAFKRWITHEVIPSIRKTGAYIVPGAEDAPASKKDIADLTAAVQLLTERLDALATQNASLPAPLMALPGNEDQQSFGPSARKRWMRTASEKLDLLSTKLGHPHSVILSQIYKIMEEKWSVNLEEERLRAAEKQNLFSCSVLAAISYNETLRDAFQDIVDFNLAPENRGW